MKKKNIIVTPLYNADVYCFFTKEEYAKHHEKHIGDVDLNCIGSVNHYTNKNGYLIVMVGIFNDDIGTLAHELVHVLSRIYLVHGIYYDTENDEPYAYLYQSLFLSVNQRLLEHYNKG